MRCMHFFSQKTGILFTMLTALILYSSKNYAQATFVAEKGVLNLSNFNWTKNETVALDGEWEFYWKQLLSSEDFAGSDHIVPDAYVNVPSSWNGTILSNNDTVTGKGYATYRLKIIIKNAPTQLSMQLRDYATAYRLFVNGKKVASAGNVSNIETEGKPEYNPQLAFFSTKSTDTLEVIMQISNYHHTKGGWWDKIILGESQQLITKYQSGLTINAIIIGILAIMCLYHLSLYVWRRKEYSLLYFTALTFLYTVRGLVTNERILGDWLPQINWQLLNKIEYISGYASLIFVVLFFNTFSFIGKRYTRILVWIGVVISLTIVVFPVYYFSQLKVFFDAYAFLGSLSVLVMLLIATIRKKESAFLAFFGFLIWFLSVINDILYSSNLLQSFYILPYGLTAFVFVQSYLLGKNFSLTFLRNKELTIKLDYQNKNLEKIVEKRTEKINLQNRELEQQMEEINTQTEQLKSANNSIIEQNEKIRTAYQNIQQLSKIGKEITSHLSIEQIIATVYENINTLMDATIFAIGVYNTEKNCIDFSGTIEKGEVLPFTSDSLDEADTFSVRCFSRQEELIVGELSAEFSAYFPEMPVPKVGEIPESLIYLPLIVKDKKIGVISVQSFKKSSYTSYHINILRNVGVYTAIALENAAAYEKIELQKRLIERQNEHITGSIRYAKTIQRAILPLMQNLNYSFKSFIIYRPKDIVSGDFYWLWINPDKKQTFVAVADCTGHGVPGAFMSMIGNRLLNEIVAEKRIESPREILEQIDTGIRKSLKQATTHNSDGMDVCLCRITPTNNEYEVTFCGAKRPLYYTLPDKDELQHLRGDRRSLGGNYSAKKEFTNQTFIAPDGSMLYLSSDGIVDQNAQDRKKFGTTHLKQLLAHVSSLELEEQKKLIEQNLENYMQGVEQRDDITLIGIKL